MKSRFLKIAVFAGMFLFSVSSFAQTWTRVGSATPFTDYPAGTSGTTTQYRIAIGSTAAATSQLYVLSQAASLVPLIINTQTSPTVDIADFQQAGTTKISVTSAGNLSINNNDILLRTDVNHGLGWYGTGKLWNSIAPDGPVLYGWSGGMLGTNQSGTKTNILYWNATSVGIGTTTPGSAFQVNGNAAIGYSASTVAPANGLLVSGPVGIGTTTTGSCKLAVAGKIAAREVIVTQASSWPDYVFQNDYKLTSLAEVEKQIKRDGHLDGIPSAAEVKKNGVPVGEMQAKVLQKVEELTLHMIDIQKENDELKLKVSKLELAAKAR